MRIADWLTDAQSMSGDDMPSSHCGQYARTALSQRLSENNPADTGESALGSDRSKKAPLNLENT